MIHQAEAACGNPADQFLVQANPITGVLPPVISGQARVVLFEYRGNIFMPLGPLDARRHYLYGPTMRIGLDGKWIGATKGRSYIVFFVAPGAHHLCVQWQRGPGTINSGTIALAAFTAAANETYVRAVSFIPGAYSAALEWLPIDADEENLLLNTSVPAVFTIKKQNRTQASGDANGSGGSQ